MSDGFHEYDPATWEAAGIGELRSAAMDAAPAWRRHDDELLRIAQWLPRLGNVLWVYREPRTAAGNKASAIVAELRCDHPALAALTCCVKVRVDSAVTSQGPRECLEFLDADGEIQAKLFLLPDTDYLAWDEMLASRQRQPTLQDLAHWQAPLRYLRAAINRLGSPWHALPLRFAQARPMLAAIVPAALSPIGERLAAAIASDERADWLAVAST